jgi:nucleotide-binding universal stress UspA family protein
MFKNILIPISSEFYSKQVIQRALTLSEKFKSQITILYIIEEKTLKQTNKISCSYITEYNLEETKKELIENQKQSADTIIFQEINKIFKNKEISEKIVEQEYTDAIKEEIRSKKYDLLLMGFRKECILNYRLFEEVNIPIWVVGKGTSQKILAICSNLVSNQKISQISIKLAETLGWSLQILYIIDTEDCVQVDEQGKRSTKQTEKELKSQAQKFVEEMQKKQINVEIVKGSLEKQTAKKAEKINAQLVILGQEQKKKGMLGFPVKNVKKKIAEKCKYSMLFVK